jgi:hypothetical protein
MCVAVEWWAAWRKRDVFEKFLKGKCNRTSCWNGNGSELLKMTPGFLTHTS